jgi:hypothetical protein
MTPRSAVRESRESSPQRQQATPNSRFGKHDRAPRRLFRRSSPGPPPSSEQPRSGLPSLRARRCSCPRASAVAVARPPCSACRWTSPSAASHVSRTMRGVSTSPARPVFRFCGGVVFPGCAVRIVLRPVGRLCISPMRDPSSPECWSSASAQWGCSPLAPNSSSGRRTASLTRASCTARTRSNTIVNAMTKPNPATARSIFMTRTRCHTPA